MNKNLKKRHLVFLASIAGVMFGMFLLNGPLNFEKASYALLLGSLFAGIAKCLEELCCP